MKNEKKWLSSPLKDREALTYQISNCFSENSSNNIVRVIKTFETW